MKYMIYATLLAAAFGVQSVHANPVLAKPTGTPVEVNGKLLYKQPTTGNTSADTLKRGDVLQSPHEFMKSTVSGDILVQLHNLADEATIAREFGLTVRYRTRGVVLYEAPASAELQSLVDRLAADKRIRHAQIELVTNEAVPQ